MPRTRHLLVVAISLLVLTTFVQAQGAPAGGAAWKGKTPIGLSDVSATAPRDNALTQAKVVLGKALFWDKRLSTTGMQACQSCHSPEKGWSDTLPVSVKATGKANTRHSPTLYNVAYNTAFFFDGRAQTLESAVRMEWEDQLGAKGKADSIAQKLDAIPGYKKLFEEAFGPGAVSADKIAKAIASFTRTILTANTPYDIFAGGTATAMSAAAQRGWDLFRGKARCGVCHSGNLFTDGKFHMIGVGHGGLVKGDPGRMTIVNDPRMEGAMKTPTLRNVLSHPPYMHNGCFGTLESVFKWYETPYGAKNLAPEIQGGLHLSAAEKADVTEFLKALESGDDPDTLSRPQLP